MVWMSPKGLVDRLVLLHLHGQELPTRKRAAAALHRYGNPGHAQRLLDSLTDKNRFTAIRASWGLSLMPPAIVLPLLAQALNSARAKELELVAWALGALQSSSARDLLVEALRHRNRAVRQAAAGGLWRWAVAGYRSRAAIRALEAIRGKDNGSAAIVLRHMRRPPRSSSTCNEYPRGRRVSVFDRFGGAWIR